MQIGKSFNKDLADEIYDNLKPVVESETAWAKKELDLTEKRVALVRKMIEDALAVDFSELLNNK